MSRHRLHCTNPDCARLIAIPDEALGRRIRCPACKQEMRVPGTIDELTRLQEQKLCRIRIVKGPAFAGTEHGLETDRAYTFGRSDECNVQLPGPAVSKRHFSLHWVNNQWVLEDLNTTTGTHVNGLAVTKHALRGGESIEVGAYVLGFCLPGAAVQPERIAASVVIPATDSQPLAVHDEPSRGRTADEADRRLREAVSFTDFKSEHLASVGQDSRRRYTLSLATRLVAGALLLVAAAVLSLYGRSWFFHTKTVEAAGPRRLAQAPMPPGFVDALDGRDFELAARLLAELKAAPTRDEDLCTRMGNRLGDAIRQEFDRLRAQAEQALRSDQWDQLAHVFESAQAPALGPLPDDWKPLQAEVRQHECVVAAQAAARQEHWREAVGKLAEAEKLQPGSPRVAQARAALGTAMGGGLLVKVEPRVPDVQVTLNGHNVSALGEERWKLPPGAATVGVVAPGYFGGQQEIELRAGHLTVVDFHLAPQAPPELWAMVALERAAASGPLWLAAKHYGETRRVPPALAAHFVQQSENEALRSLKRNELRVAKIALQGGEELTARIWSETSTDLTTQLLPKGETRVLKRDDVGNQQDLEPRAAAELVLQWIQAKREAGTPFLETLEQLAKLRLDLGQHEDVAAAICGDLVDSCLHEAEHACAYCAGAATAACPGCEGKGFTIELVTCSRCNGTKHVDCSNCGGSGQAKCARCGGTGKITKTVSGGGLWKGTKQETCVTCWGTGRVPCTKCRNGKVTCTKCKGAGKIEEKVTCQNCKKGVIPCPACNGTGTKEGMVPQARDAAEVETAKRLQPPP